MEATTMTTSLSAFFGKDKNKAYFFSGDRYIRYDKLADKADDGYPAQIKANWPNLPFDQIDAVVNWGDGKAYFFSGNLYARYDLKKDRADEGYPAPIGNWRGLTFDSVDSVVNWGNGKAYFFKGDQYVRYDIKNDRADEGYPQPIKGGNWQGLTFDSVDAVVNWGNGKVFFFKGDLYTRYDIKADKADPGYPRRIDARNWPGLVWGQKQYNWMSDLPGIDSKKISDLTLPATHNSGAYDFISEIAPVNDLPSWIPKLKNAADSISNITGVDLFLSKKVISQFIVDLNFDLGRTQNRSVGEQLAYGVRSLDLRVCSFKGELRTYHGLVAVPVKKVLDEIRNFLDTARREVVFVNASHMSNLKPEEHQKFFGLIHGTLGERLYNYDSTKSIGEVTVGEIVRRGTQSSSRVVFFYDVSGVDLKPSLPAWVWPYQGISSEYANTSSLEKMIADQQEKLDQNSGTAQRMFELSWILTTQSEDAVTEAVTRLRALLEAVGGIPGLVASEILEKFKKKLGASGDKELSWHSLQQLSRRPNAVLWDFVGRNGGKKINFIAVDYFQDARTVELCIEMCRQLSSQAAAAA
jgi:hypothetical protein